MSKVSVARAVARDVPQEPSTEVSALFALYNYDQLQKLTLAESMSGAQVAARLHVLAMKGLIRDSQDNMVDRDDLRLIHDLADFIDQLICVAARKAAAA